MDRRKAIKTGGLAVVGSVAGIFTFANVMHTGQKLNGGYQKQDYEKLKSDWPYVILDPAVTAEQAYNCHKDGGCMYASFNGILSQLAEKIGEPYTSFPVNMMKYGSGGISGFGTICGALNGAAAITGLLTEDRTMQNNIITRLFRWYETTELPAFVPQKPMLDFIPPPSVSNSVLCHVSVTNWIKKSGYKTDSDQRKERCRRLISNVVYEATTLLNEYFSNTYKIIDHQNETVGKCMKCHGTDGELNNTLGKMDCNSCHDKSAGH